MKRRSFLGALAAIVVAPRVLTRLVQPEPTCLIEVLPPMQSVSAHYWVHPDGRITATEILARRNEILDAMPWRDA